MRERRKRNHTYSITQTQTLLTLGIFLFSCLLCMVKSSNAKQKPVLKALDLCCSLLSIVSVKHHDKQQTTRGLKGPCKLFCLQWLGRTTLKKAYIVPHLLNSTSHTVFFFIFSGNIFTSVLAMYQSHFLMWLLWGTHEKQVFWTIIIICFQGLYTEGKKNSSS